MSPIPRELQEKLDPRVKWTRNLILEAFNGLLAEKGIESGGTCGVRRYSQFTVSASIGKLRSYELT